MLAKNDLFSKLNRLVVNDNPDDFFDCMMQHPHSAVSVKWRRFVECFEELIQLTNSSPKLCFVLAAVDAIHNLLNSDVQGIEDVNFFLLTEKGVGVVHGLRVFVGR